MSGVTTRDALEAALRKHNRGVISAGELADALLASGAVIDAATLADDQALHQVVADAIYDHACDPTGYKAIAILRALAAALSERTS